MQTVKKIGGKTNYLTLTKSDIPFTVSVVNQFLSTLRTTNLQAVMRILRYLKKAPERGLLYSDNRHTRVASFSDANWAG